MKLTTRGRFAVTSMIDLALYGEQGPVRLMDIARRQKMSLAYLEQIFCKLRRAHIVKSVRGPGGGYLLGRSADEITAGQIVAARVFEFTDAADDQGSQHRPPRGRGVGSARASARPQRRHCGDSLIFISRPRRPVGSRETERFDSKETKNEPSCLS